MYLALGYWIIGYTKYDWQGRLIKIVRQETGGNYAENLEGFGGTSLS